MRGITANTLLRAVLFIVALLAVIQGWWYIAFIIAIISAWVFPMYIEVILLGLVHDSLFGFIPGQGLYSYTGSILALILFIISEAASRFVRK